MDTLKTAVIVVLLLAVVYGAYVVLNKPDAPLPQEIAWHEQKATEPLQIDLGSPTQTSTGKSDSKPASPDSMWSASSKAVESDKPSMSDLSPEKPTSETDIVPKPSAAGLNVSAGSAGLPPEKPTDISAVTSPATPPSIAAPNLLGSASVANSSVAGASPDKKASSDTGFPSLPELRKSIPDNTKLTTDTNNPPAGSQAETWASQADSSVATNPSTIEATAPSQASSIVPATNQAALGRDNVSASASNAAGTSTGKSVTTSAVFDAALREAQLQIDGGKWNQALFILSKFIHSPDLNDEQQEQLFDLLDPLAAKVVYSAEHLVEPAYEVRRGDRLADIAQTYQLPWELLANVNSIENPDLLVPGIKLKVLRGPFRAEVNLSTSELTVFAGQLYAGRFPISVGNDPAPKAGEYRVLEKQPGRVYYAGDGRTIAAEDSANPYGRVWLRLGNELSIHGSPEGGETRGMGCISLSPLDATDVYCILSQGSSVVIRR